MTNREKFELLSEEFGGQDLFLEIFKSINIDNFNDIMDACDFYCEYRYDIDVENF